MSVTVTYFLGGSVQIQSTTVPTAAQSILVPKMAVQVNWALADVQALITHNWGLAASGPSFFDPEVIGPLFILGPLGAGTSVPLYTFDWTNTNVLKVNKNGIAGSEGTFVLVLRRPHSTGL
jgi:hypothetical protein